MFLKHLYADKFILLCVIAFIFKTIQFIIVPAQLVTDSADYILISKNIFDTSPAIFGLRVPVYPLFLKICSIFSSSPGLIVFIQIIFGFASVLILFKLVKDILNEKTAFIASLLFLFSPTSLFDSVIASENLTIFLLIVFLYLLIKSIQSNKLFYFVLSGIVLSLLILTRPQYLLFIPAMMFYFLFRKENFKVYTSVLIPLFISLIWALQVYNNTGIFNLTTLAGYNLINHTGKFIEKAPENYEPLKSIYINKRNEYLKTVGNQGEIIWLVRDSVQKAMDISKTELSRVLLNMSMYLILHEPLDYLRSVWASIRIALIVPDEDFRIINNSFPFRILLPLYQLIIGFGLITGIVLAFSKNKIIECRLNSIMLILVITNLLASALFDYGSNGRFFAPVYFILFIWTSVMIVSLKENFRERINDKIPS